MKRCIKLFISWTLWIESFGKNMKRYIKRFISLTFWTKSSGENMKRYIKRLICMKVILYYFTLLTKYSMLCNGFEFTFFPSTWIIRMKRIIRLFLSAKSLQALHLSVWCLTNFHRQVPPSLSCIFSWPLCAFYFSHVIMTVAALFQEANKG